MRILNTLKIPTVADIVATSASFASRFNFLPANVSPLGSVGFFGNPVLFIISILLFDFVFRGVYPGVLFTYLGFACYPLLGWVAKRFGRANKTTTRQLIALPIASFLFFLLSNLGVWFYWYEHTLQQLLICYALAAPFYARTLVGDLGFGYGYLVYKNRSYVIRYARRVLKGSSSDQMIQCSHES